MKLEINLEHEVLYDDEYVGTALRNMVITELERQLRPIVKAHISKKRGHLAKMVEQYYAGALTAVLKDSKK